MRATGHRPSDQARYLVEDFRRASRNGWWRKLTVPFSQAFITLAAYRAERAAYLLLGRGWPVVRAALSPVRLVVRPWLGQAEIHYTADIGPGATILHPKLGLVIGRGVVIGPRAIFAGGNVVGLAAKRTIPIQAGRELQLGVHAKVLGEVELGDNVRVGAGAIVLDSFGSDTILVGMPARPTTGAAIVS